MESRRFAAVSLKAAGNPAMTRKAVFFGDGAGLFVVFGDVRELVAQIHLDDLLDVFVEFGEALLDLGGLGPDAAVDERFLVIGEVHQPGEILAEAHRIDEHKRRAARRMRGEQAQRDRLSARVGGPSSAPSLSIRSDPWSGNPSANGAVRRPPAGRRIADPPGSPPVSFGDIHLDAADAHRRRSAPRAVPMQRNAPASMREIARSDSSSE